MKLNKKIIVAVFSLALLVQIIIILYNQITGFIQISSIANFFIRITIGTTFSSIFGLIIVALDLFLIASLDKILTLPQKLPQRIPAELFLATITGIIIGVVLTLVANLLFPYQPGLEKIIINNSLITAVLNIIVVLAVEAVLWFKRSQESLVKAEKLERENSQIRFETLKSQLNPHFLFNSLNVLSSLIKKDSDRAQNFIDEFSSVYRYTLDVIEKPVVELREELEFAKSFLYLQKIRFDNSVVTEINVDASLLNHLVPPLGVQTLLENAFKHNRASVDNPLRIKIYNEGSVLIVVNNLQPKLRGAESRGVGLSNLRKRYELLGDALPNCSVTEEKYIARIPLIFPEN